MQMNEHTAVILTESNSDLYVSNGSFDQADEHTVIEPTPQPCLPACETRHQDSDNIVQPSSLSRVVTTANCHAVQEKERAVTINSAKKTTRPRTQQKDEESVVPDNSETLSPVMDDYCPLTADDHRTLTAVPVPDDHCILTAVPVPDDHCILIAVPVPGDHCTLTAVPVPDDHCTLIAVPVLGDHCTLTVVPVPDDDH